MTTKDYNKVFTDEPSYNFGFGEIYRKRGIAKQGCVLIVRPDQFVAAKLSLLDSDKLSRCAFIIELCSDSHFPSIIFFCVHGTCC